MLATCQIKADHFNAFEDGKQYTYEYKARVATGVPKAVNQFSGFGVTGQLVAQSQGNYVKYHLQNVKIGYFNQPVDGSVLGEWPINYEKPSADVAAHVSPLQQPFYVEYDHGLVKHVYVPKGEGVEQRNNQKALASLFQLYLERDVPNLHVYTKNEDSIGGTSQVTYILGHYDSHYEEQPHEDVLNVTKYRKSETVQNQPHLFYSSIKGYQCTDCEQKFFKPLKNDATVHYDLKGTRDKYIIEHIEALGGIDFTPFTTNGQTVVSVVNQTLQLVSVGSGAAFSKPDDYEQTNLFYEFENDRRDYENVNLKQAHYYNRVYATKHSDHVAEAKTLFQLLQTTFQDPHAHVSEFVPQFVDILSEFNYDEFQAFYSKYVLVDKPDSAAHMLLEILPVVGTNPSILFALHAIQEGKVDVSNANEIIQKIPFYVKEPSQKLVEEARAFGQHKSVTGNPKLYASSRLAYGTLVYKGCVANVFNPHPKNAQHYISDDVCAQYLKGLIKLFQGASDNYQRAIYLRAIINTHLDHDHDFILSVLNGQYDNSIKVIAIVGLADVDPGTKNPKIPAVLLPLFTDPNVDYVLRACAFELLLYLYPSSSYFAKLVLILEKDPSEKLKSYIYVSLNAYANASNPCFQPYKQHIKHVLQYVEHRHLDFIKDSVNRYYTVQNGKYNYGRSKQLVILPSNESIFPREIYYRQSANILGYEFDFLEAGYSAQGRTFYESHILGAIGLGPSELAKGRQEVNDDLVKKTIEMLQKTDKSHIPLKEHQIYFKACGQNVYVTNDLLKSYVTNDLLKSLEQRRQSSGYRYEDDKIVVDLNTLHYIAIELLIPNELGMPVSLKSRIPLTGYVHGSFHASEKLGKVGDSYKGVGLEVTNDLHIGMDAVVQSHVAVLSAVYGPLGYRLTTKTGIHVPLKGSIDVDIDNHKTKIHYIPSTTPYDIVYYKTVPETVGRNTAVPIHYSSTPVNKQYSRGHDFLGVGLTYNFTYDYYRNDFGAYRDFFRSFFSKSHTHEHYKYISEKIYAGVHNFLDYAILNPTAKPFSFNARFSQSEINPTTEFVYESENYVYKKYDVATQRGEKELVYKNQITGKGTVPRQWNLEVTAAVSWPYRVARRMNIHYKRSAIPNYDSNPYEICYNAKADITEYKKIYSLQSVDIKANFYGKLTFGKTCDEGAKQINVKAVIEKSEEQQNRDIAHCPVYNKCQELGKKGQTFNRYCYETIQDLARLDKVTLDIDYQNIPDDVKGVFYRVYQYFRHTFYNNLYIDHFHGSGQPNHINIVANLSYHHPEIFDVKITRSDQIVYYNKVYAPAVWPQWEPYRVTETFYERFPRKVYNYHVPKCIVTGKYVRTFDGVLYKASLTTDYHLALTDVNHVFVYYRQVEGSKYSKALKAYFSGVNVEFVPRGDNIDVTVNGKPVLTGNSAAYFHKVDGEVVGVVYKYAEGYIVKPLNYGLELYFDGDNSIISACNLYRENQHGICGTFDGETRNEFQGPDGKIYHDPSDFTHSYIVHT